MGDRIHCRRQNGRLAVAFWEIGNKLSTPYCQALPAAGRNFWEAGDAAGRESEVAGKVSVHRASGCAWFSAKVVFHDRLSRFDD